MKIMITRPRASAATFLLGVSITAILSSFGYDNIIGSCDAFSHAGDGGVILRRRSGMLIPLPSSSSSALISSCSNSASIRHHRNHVPSLPSALLMSSSTQNSNNNHDDDDALAAIVNGITRELQEFSQCTSIIYNYLSKPDGEVTATDIVHACDAIDEAAVTVTGTQQQLLTSAVKNLDATPTPKSISYLDQLLSLRRRSHEFGRYHLLVKLLRSNYDAYVSTAEFLSPSRISRMDLPNIQDVKYAASNDDDNIKIAGKKDGVDADEEGLPLVPDCTLQEMTYITSPLDALLLSIFRKFVSEYTQMSMQSDIPGIEGLVVQGRSYMTKDLPEGVTYSEHADEQHDMVKTVLGRLMTPVLPPFYRIFMSGIVPANNNLPESIRGKQLGPWFYAPYLTSIVTPIFFGFLVGPSYPNRRKDGQRGGLVVEKCKFLQESQCKGLCLHQCKLPAQEFFAQNLGLELTVSPNFVTQECQWSFGERPLEVQEDSSFPVGCLVGCESRKGMAVKKGTKGDAICM